MITVKEVERDDYDAIKYVYEHPTLSNVEVAIDYVTNLGVNAITLDAKK